MDGGGGYEPGMYSYDNYVPGQESPWGIPDVSGGNKDFYRNQFINLLKDEQGFQKQQETAAKRRQHAIQNPLERSKLDWAWLDDPSKLYATASPGPEGSEGVNGTGYKYNPNLTINRGETTNEALVSQMIGAGLLNAEEADFFSRHFAGIEGQERAKATNYGVSKDYDAAQRQIASIGSAEPGTIDALTKVFNNIWTNTKYSSPDGGGPSTPAGYANPMEAYYNSKSAET